MTENNLKIGRVIEVDGARTIGELAASVQDLYRTHKSRRYAIGQVGSIVKIEVGDLLIFGVVTALRMYEALSDDSKPSRVPSSGEKTLHLELFGQGRRTGLNEGDFEFERGISTYPLPGQSIFLATVEELRQIYTKPENPSIRIGALSQARGLPVHLITDELLGKHFAVLGTTGSGKSCAVALILQAIIKECPFAHIIVLDPHDEYSRAFPGQSARIDPTTLNIPHWLLDFQESIELFIGKTEFQATSQTNILKDALLKARVAFAGAGSLKVTVDTPIPYRMGDLVKSIQSVKKSDSQEKILAKIDTLRADRRFAFMLQDDAAVKDDLATLLSELFRMPGQGKPISIIDLSGVPSDVVDVVVSVLCRTIFDFALWNPRRREMPLLLVCEEAHRYAPKGDEAAFQPTKQALARIAKEGRKYGVGLALVTQRPSELSESILSQCNSVIALRMSNDQDQQFVRRALPDSVRSLVETLPALRTREALVVGEGTVVPVRVVFDEIPEERRPRSADVQFAVSWQKEIGDLKTTEEVIDKWRRQERVS